jgi:hypothetical protein
MYTLHWCITTTTMSGDGANEAALRTYIFRRSFVIRGRHACRYIALL